MSDKESGKGPGRKRLVEGIEIIVEESMEGLRSAARRSGVESVGENIKETLQGALSARHNVVMVRLNEESLSRLDELVESGVVSSRSESAAYLIGEGIRAKAGLFDRIAEKIEEIRKAKRELRDLLDETPDDTSAKGKGDPKS